MNVTLKKKWGSFLPSDIELFKLINEVTSSNNCAYFLIGAKARDILLEYFGKNAAQRATLDTDMAICCKNWDEFYKIKNTFIHTTDFIADNKHEHRMVSPKFGYLDILPFGDIKKENPNLKWPPEYDIEFSLVGFDDAYNSAIEIDINEINVKVASPLGLVLLKLFAWISRQANKDASDFINVVSNYLDFDNQDRFNSEHTDLLLEEHFDYVLSGCRLLGRDLKGLSLGTQSHLKEFFDNNILMNKLAISITQPQIDYDLAVSMLEMIKQGFND
jgi:predicted nucleotidyltransferase